MISYALLMIQRVSEQAEWVIALETNEKYRTHHLYTEM